jgi:hypothetical protein
MGRGRCALGVWVERQARARRVSSARYALAGQQKTRTRARGGRQHAPPGGTIVRIEVLDLSPAVSALLILASLPDCSHNQTAVWRRSDTLRLLSDF